jgi:3-hydroxyisobutyrate dehydrogenase
MNIGWIGLGRMGYAMAERILRAGHGMKMWNRTASKAAPLAALGGEIVASPHDLAGVDALFMMLATGKDLEQVLLGKDGILTTGSTKPKLIVDCSSIGMDESVEIRARLTELGVGLLAAPVSGNGHCVRAGKLSCVVSGPQAAFEQVKPYLLAFAPKGVTYVGEGELARICKIAHNVMLGVVIENLIEITLLAQKAGVPRHAFLAFMNNSVMGSLFTKYKSPALVNCDWSPTFTPELLRKDLELGLAAGRQFGVTMPVTAVTKEVLQSHIGTAATLPDPNTYLAADFARMLETLGIASGLRIEPENVPVPTGFED